MNGSMRKEPTPSIMHMTETNVMVNSNKYLNRLILVILLTPLVGIQPALANRIGQPIITLSVTGCQQFFLLQIFENGQVEYRDFFYKKTKGKNKTQLSTTELNALLKKFNDADFISADNRYMPTGGHGMHREAIQFRQGDRESTVFWPDTSKNPIIKQLDLDIIKATRLEKWIPKINAFGCPPNSQLIFFFKDLKRAK